MTALTLQPPIGQSIAAFWRCFAQQAGGRLWVAVAFLILIGLLEGSGLLMLVPVLQKVGLGGAHQATGDSILNSVENISAALSLPTALALFVAIKAAQAALRAASSTFTLKIQTDFDCFLRERFYRTMIRAHWLFLTRQRSSDLSQALLVELSTVGHASQLVLSFLSVALVGGAQVAAALSLSVPMTALAIGSGLMVAFALRGLRRRGHALGEFARKQRSEMTAAVSEHLAGMKIAKSHGRETQHFTHFHRAMTEIAAHAMRLHRVSALTGVWLEIGAVFALALFVLFASGRVDSARLLVLMFVFTRLLSHNTTLQNLWHGIARSLPSFTATERLRAELAAAAEPPAPAVPARIALRDAIRLEDVAFAYDPTQPNEALRGLSLAFPARQVTALCGPSGAGKSTLADLLLGLLSPTRGRVLVDGAELAGERIHSWRQSVGYVPQDTFLFHETIRANLLWAQPEASEGDIRAALRAAAAEEFVDRLPLGLDTVVGDRGMRLSGGERQRLALARALLRRPTLLILDEATSSLDPGNERLVQDAIEKLHGELTIVLIAHRLSTVRFADRIVVLEQGVVAESGTWDELCAREHGVFRKLAAADQQA